MISDILSDATKAMADYLNNPHTADCYSEPAITCEILEVMQAMTALRIKLDTPPDPLFRNDAWKSAQDAEGMNPHA